MPRMPTHGQRGEESSGSESPGSRSPERAGSESSEAGSPKRDWLGTEKSGKHSTYIKAVESATAKGDLWPDAKDLANGLHMKLSSCDNDRIQRLLIGQYNIAKSTGYRKRAWMKELRFHVRINQSDEWIQQNLGGRPRKERKPDTAVATTTSRLSREVKREPEDLPVESIPDWSEFPPLGPPLRGEPTPEGGEERAELEPERHQLELMEVDSVPSQAEAGDSGVVIAGVELGRSDEVHVITISDEEDNQSQLPDQDLRERLNRSRRTHENHPSASKRVRRSRSPVVRRPQPTRIFTNRSHAAKDTDRPGPIEAKRPHSGTKLKVCPIPGCPARPRNARRHVMERHIPSRFWIDNLMDVDQHPARMVTLHWIRQRILGPNSTLQQLVEWVNRQGSMPFDVFVPNTDYEWLSATCRTERWGVPGRFLLCPINSAALLCHWRAFCICLAQLTVEDRGHVYHLDDQIPRPVDVEEAVAKPLALTVVDSVGDTDDGFDCLDVKVVDSVGFEAVDLSPDTQVIAGPSVQRTHEAIDSHFHFDRSARMLGRRNKISTIQDLIDADVGVKPELPVTVVGGVVVYCDPEAYPRQLSQPLGFGIAVGVHPRKAALFTDLKFSELQDLLRRTEVVALGEVGLDHTEPEGTWKLQEETLVRVCSLSMPVRPLVLHIRDGNDKHSGELGARCLQILKENVAPTQRVHLHCFGGTVEQVVSWAGAFPHCYFGFAGNVQQFDTFQEAALRRVPSDRLLLETDAPYLKTDRRLVISTPAFVGDVANLVSRVRQSGVADILKQTATNARRLYKL